MKADMGTMGGIGFQQCFQRLGRLPGIAGRRQPERDAHRSHGAGHVTGSIQAGDPRRAGNLQRRAPGAVENHLGTLVVNRAGTVQERKPGVERVAKYLRRVSSLHPALFGDLHLKARIVNASVGLVLKSTEELPQQAEGGGYDAAGVTGMHPLAENFHAQIAGGHSPE
jgi:hypothetical protein